MLVFLLGFLRVILYITAVLFGIALFLGILWFIITAFCLTLDTIYSLLGKEEPDWLENLLLSLAGWNLK
jgi:4-hydroxybenzoate polyprenyltransferase